MFYVGDDINVTFTVNEDLTNSTVVLYYRKPNSRTAVEVNSPTVTLPSTITYSIAADENTAPGKLDVHTSDLIMKSILITGPRLIKRGGVELIHKKGKDNIIRFNLINVCILLFTNNQMLYFNCCYDLISEKASLVSTEEFFYKDIVSTSTDTIETTYEDKEGKVQKLETADCFRVRTSGGTAIEVVLTSPKLLELWGGGVIPTDFIEDAISKIRKILRDKKQA